MPLRLESFPSIKSWIINYYFLVAHFLHKFIFAFGIFALTFIFYEKVVHSTFAPNSLELEKYVKVLEI
jgi:hypothetical protein